MTRHFCATTYINLNLNLNVIQNQNSGFLGGGESPCSPSPSAMADDREALISSNSGSGNRSVKFARCASHPQDELQSFRSYLRWMCVDQSDAWSACLSWSVFFVFAIVVPIASHFLLACASCDGKHARPFDGVVQLSLSGVAALSFVCLSRFVRKYGLRRFLFFDKLWDESETVRKGYTEQLNVRSLYLSLVISVSVTVMTIFWFLLHRIAMLTLISCILLS